MDNILNEGQFKDLISCEAVYFPEINFKINGNITNGDLKIDLSKQCKKVDSGKISAALLCKITNDNEEFDLKILVAGKFTLADNIEANKFSDKDFEIKALQMLFPYLASQVTLVTTQPGFKSITLPIIDMNNFYTNKEIQE